MFIILPFGDLRRTGKAARLTLKVPIASISITVRKPFVLSSSAVACPGNGPSHPPHDGPFPRTDTGDSPNEC